MSNVEVHTRGFAEGGGELTIGAMDEDGRTEIGRKTFRFVQRVMRDPVLRAKIKARAEEIRREERGDPVLPGG